jgi:hypothetical protein
MSEINFDKQYDADAWALYFRIVGKRGLVAPSKFAMCLRAEVERCRRNGERVPDVRLGENTYRRLMGLNSEARGEVLPRQDEAFFLFRWLQGEYLEDFEADALSVVRADAAGLEVRPKPVQRTADLEARSELMAAFAAFYASLDGQGDHEVARARLLTLTASLQP